MARRIAMWHDFFSQPEVNLRFKDGHVVSDMAERKSVMLRRIVVMDMLPRLVQASQVAWGYSVRVNNVSQNVVCIGDTCREVSFEHTAARAAHQPENRLIKTQVESDPQSRSPERKNRISSDRTEETVVKTQKKMKTPAAPPKWHAGQPALQCNAEERLKTSPDIERGNHSTMTEQRRLKAVAAEVEVAVGNRSGQEVPRRQPGCRHEGLRGNHLCHHGHRGTLQSCSPGSANRTQCLVACQPAGQTATRIAVAV